MSVQKMIPSAKKLMLLLALAVSQLQAQDLAHYKRVIKEISPLSTKGGDMPKAVPTRLVSICRRNTGKQVLMR